MQQVVERRHPVPAGSRPPRTYTKCIERLVAWAEENLDEDDLEEFDVVECLSARELSEKLEEQGEEFDADTGDRVAAEETFMRLQHVNLGVSEEDVELHDESHPEGLQKFTPLPFATYRTCFPWNPAGEAQKELPEKVQRLMQQRLLVVRTVEQSEAEWGGTGERLMVESVVAGVPKESVYGAMPALEVMEMLAKYRTAVLEPRQWEALPEVQDAEEAAALAKSDLAVTVMKIVGARARVELDMPETWDAKAYDLSGNVVSVEDMEDAGGWEELCKLQDVRSV
jgi:hypothetical protein